MSDYSQDLATAPRQLSTISQLLREGRYGDAAAAAMDLREALDRVIGNALCLQEQLDCQDKM